MRQRILSICWIRVAARTGQAAFQEIFQTGQQLAQKARTAEAAAAFKHALSLTSDAVSRAQVHQQLGLTTLAKHERGEFVTVGEWKRAAVQFAAAASLKVSNEWLAVSYHCLGTCLGYIGRLNESLPYYDMALRTDPTEHSAWISKARGLEGLRRKSEAVAAYRVAIALQPSVSPGVFFNLAMLLPSHERVERDALLQQIRLRDPVHQGAQSIYVSELQWQNRMEEAKHVIHQAVSDGIFPSEWQRPQVSVTHGLIAKPFWTGEEFHGLGLALRLMRLYWRRVAQEHQKLKDQRVLWQLQTDGIADPNLGSWEISMVFQRNSGCHPKMPITCGLLRELASPMVSLDLLDAEFSALQAAGHLRSHCGPHNRRLTIHLPLSAPRHARSIIRVMLTLIRYVAGKPFVFDDSFEHEVWNDSNETRTVLIVTISHPSLAMLS